MHDIFNNLSPTVLAAWLAFAAGSVLLVVAGMALTNLFLLRMGVRNMLRRPGQMLIQLCGLALSMAIIMTALGLQDSFDASMGSYRLTQMGNVDETITGTFTQNQVDSALTRIKSSGAVQVVAGIHYERGGGGSHIQSLRTGLSIGGLDTYAVSSDFDAVYGPLTDASGQRVHFADLRPDEVMVSTTLAQQFDVRAGDTLSIQYRFGQSSRTITSVAKVRFILSNDLALTAGDLAANFPHDEIILPLATYQRLSTQQGGQSIIVDTICVKNVGAGGMDDIGPNGARSQAVIALLQQIFGVPGLNVNGGLDLGITFDSIIIHPLKPDMVLRYGVPLSFSVRQTNAGRQFNFAIPLLTDLLIGAAMLFLALLFLLLASERRAELGMSRAVGLQRYHLLQLMLIEGCGYSLLALLPGMLLGAGLIGLILLLLTNVPTLGGAHIPLFVSVSWQHIVSACSFEVLTSFVALLITALWISRTNIVTAIRNLDDPPAVRVSLHSLVHVLRYGRATEASMPLLLQIGRSRALLVLIWELIARGPLCLLAGVLLTILAQAYNQVWLHQAGMALLIAGAGLLLNQALRLCRLSPRLAWRLSASLVGVGWLVSSLSESSLLGFFIDTIPADDGIFIVVDNLFSAVVPVAGAVVLLMTNADLLVALCTRVGSAVRGLAPVVRIGLAYPLTFRFRTGVTVALLGLVMLLVMLFVTANLVTIQQTQVSTVAGGFQLADMIDSRPDLIQRVQADATLRQDIAQVALLRPLLGVIKGNSVSPSTPPLSLLIAGHTSTLQSMPTSADNAFLSSTSMPMLARAQSYASDRAIWHAVRDHVGYAVLRFDPDDPDLPTANGFTPFTARIADSNGPNAHYYQVTVIGILSVNTQFPSMFLSNRTSVSIGLHPVIAVNTYLYLFQLRSGISEARATQDLERVLGSVDLPLTLQTLDPAQMNGVTESLTFVIAGYLLVGLLFGAFAIGVIVSRSVVERRQQIGMLRALGFSRGHILSIFLLEASFVITLGLLIGTALAGWLAYQLTLGLYPTFSLPALPIVLILLGCYLIAFVATLLPARQASRLPPAEALRYE